VLARSLVVPGWGHAATGDRRGLLLTVGFGLAATTLLVIAWAYAAGPAATIVFLLGTSFAAAWLAQAIHASRRAARRWERGGTPSPRGGLGAVVAGLAVATLLAVLFWSIAGEGASAASRASAYAAAWWAGRPEAAAGAFDPPLDPAAIDTAWAEQTPRLRNALVSAAADAGPLGGIDPDRPFDSVRFVPVTADEAARGGADDDRAVFDVEIVRRVRQPTRLLGILPATSTVIETAERIGTVTLRLVGGDRSGLLPGIPSWRVETVDLFGTSIGG
jgi:hypothetical protein